MNFVGKNYLLLVLVLIATVLLTSNINKPFIGHHDWNGAFWGTVVDRYLNYFFHGNPQGISFSSLIFTHYTPFMPVLFTISSAIFGLSEFSLRLVPVFFSIFTVVFVYKIGERLFGKLEGLVASLFLMATPMFLYFGKLPDHEPIVVSLVVATFYFFIRIENKGTIYFKLFLFFLFLSLLESWPAYFLIVPLTLISVFIRKERLSTAILPFLVGIMVVVLHLCLLLAVRGFPGVMEFVQSGIGRSTTQGLFFGATQYSPSTFVITEARYAAIYFTRILLLLSSLYSVRFVYRFFTRTLKANEIYLAVFFFYPLTFIAFFRGLAFIHDYKLYHFLPFISLSAAVFFCYLLGKLKKFFEDANLRTITIKLSLVFIIFATWALVYMERLPYLEALQATSFNTPGYDLGLLIRDNTESGEYVFVNSDEFGEFYGVFVDYYSGRRVDHGDLSMEDYKNMEVLFGNYKYLIFVKGRPYDKELFNLLRENHTSTSYGDYTFFTE